MTFQEKRARFFERMERLGMAREQANYCITIAKRLQAAYSTPTSVAELEDEAIAKLRNVLDELPKVYIPQSDEEVFWSCVPGGLCEGDSTPLYIVPPCAVPIAVPTPPEAVANDPMQEAQAKAEVASILDAWSKPPPEPEQKPEEVGAKAHDELLTIGYNGGNVDWLTKEVLAEMILQAKAHTRMLFEKQYRGRRDGKDDRAEHIGARVDEKAKLEGWDERITTSRVYQQFRRTMIDLELLREAQDPREAMMEREARYLFERIRMEHVVKRETDTEFAKTATQVMIQSQGHNLLREVNEKRKRMGRYRK